MECELVFRGGKVFTGKKFEAKYLGISKGKIAAIGKGLKGKQTIACKGRLVLPGAMDMHVHLRDFNESNREDWASGTRAAVHGGVSCVFDMPNNKGFPMDTVARLHQKERRALTKSLADFGLYALIDRVSLPHIKTLAPVCVGFKLYMSESVNTTWYLSDADMEAAFKAVAKTKKMLVVHAEDRETNDRFKERVGKRNDALAHYDSRPNLSEAIAVHKALAWAKKHGTKLHLTHVSTTEALPLIALAKKRGVDVTADCSFTHLLFGLDDHAKKKHLLKVNPPVRTEADREALWIALRKGVIDFIASDHAPHPRKEKFGKAAAGVPSGLPWLDFFLPRLYKLCKDRKIPFEQALPWVTERPAKRFKVKGKGRLAKGLDADVVVFNPGKPVRVTEKAMFSKSKWHACEGEKLPGSVERTFIRGIPVFDGAQGCLDRDFEARRVKTA